MDMHRGMGAMGLALLAPLCAAWTGGGAARGTWIEGEHKTVLAEQRLGGDAVVSMEADGAVHLVATIALPGAIGDAVLGLHLEPGAWTRGPVPLDDRVVDLRYTEYGSDGEILFRDDGEPQGKVALAGNLSDGLVISLDADLFARQDAQIWRRLESVRFSVQPTASAADDDDVDREPDVEVQGVVNSGCDDGWDDETDDDDGWGSGSSADSSGCDGDDLDSGSSSGSSGCDGDGLDTGGSSGCDGGCDGDAIAGGHGARRSVWALRVINWTPWLLVFGAIRLLRRRRRA